MSKRGSISLSGLVGLYVIVSLLPLTVSLFSLVAGLDFDYYELENELSLSQLRRILLISYDLDVYGDRLSFVYHGEDYSLHEVNGHLILTPGTQIFLEDVELCLFYEREGVIYVSCYHKDKEYEYALCQAGGLRISDFPADILEQPDLDAAESRAGEDGV